MTKRLPTFLLVAAAFLAVPAVAQEPAASPPPSGQPANLCQELLAFVKPPVPTDQPATTPVAPQQQVAVSAPTNQGEQKPGGGAGAVQQNSGLSGPISNDSTAAGGASVKPAASGRSAANAAAAAPASPPAAPAPPTKPSPEAVAQAKAAVATDDPAACRASVQSMRRAGVTMPSTLLALGALDLKFFAAR